MQTRFLIALGAIAGIVAVVAALRRRGRIAARADEFRSREGVVSARSLEGLTRDELYEQSHTISSE